jgi:hypothetical protein
VSIHAELAVTNANDVKQPISCAFFGVYDGHGGAYISEMLRDKFHVSFASHLASGLTSVDGSVLSTIGVNSMVASCAVVEREVCMPLRLNLLCYSNGTASRCVSRLCVSHHFTIFLNIHIPLVICLDDRGRPLPKMQHSQVRNAGRAKVCWECSGYARHLGRRDISYKCCWDRTIRHSGSRW